MKEQLKQYVSGNKDYTNLLNILMGQDRPQKGPDGYSILGKYFCEKCNNILPKELSFYQQRLDKEIGESKIKKFLSFNSWTDIYSSIFIWFSTSSLNAECLKKMFGDPLLHDEFGEGFDGEYDEETDTESEPDIKESYASYFVTVGGVDMHIGYDHRGTGIEVDPKTDYNKTVEALKSLIDIYFDKCN